MESLLTKHRVADFEIIGPYRLRVFFEDDTYQEINFRPVLVGRMYSPLKKLSFFNQVCLEADGVLTWPNGVDFSPDTLYHWPEKLPALLKNAREWRRGFKVSTPLEESQPILFDWDKINELVDKDIEQYRAKIPYFYGSIVQLELDIKVAKRLYEMEPHPHILRRIKTLEGHLLESRKLLESCLEEFGNGVENKLSRYCRKRAKKTRSDLKFENKNIKIEKELQGIESQLRTSKDEWQWHVTRIIAEIPSGHLATYGCIAKIANQCFGHTLIPQHVAWLRKHLYGLLLHNTHVPLHRIAKAGDVESLADSDKTKKHNDRLRSREGSLDNPVWWHPHA